MYNGRINSSRINSFIQALRYRPNAVAEISGNDTYPIIKGRVTFYQTRYGVLVIAEVFSLPYSDEKCENSVFGFHIHSGESCTGNEQDPFADALSHYNPNNCTHPHHSGDLPSLFGNSGYAFSAFLTDRFSVNEIINKTVIIHSMPDDFTTDPSGNSGQKIACGKIKKT